MDVREAVASRFSCRAFRPDPVPEQVVRAIVEAAARAPSGGNIQPWRVYAIADDRMTALRTLLAPRMNELPKAEGTEYPVFPPDMKDPYRARRFAVGEMLYKSINVTREDRPGRLGQYARNFQFFGAPVGLFFAIDRSLGSAQWSDLGGYLQTMALLARAHGLHTCLQEAWASWHKTIAAFIQLPPEYILFCGMALGHADTSAAINGWRSPREPLDSYATFSGFAQ